MGRIDFYAGWGARCEALSKELKELKKEQ